MVGEKLLSQLKSKKIKLPFHMNASQDVCISDWDETLRSGYTIISWLNYLENIGFTDRIGVQSVLNHFTSYENGLISYENLVVSVAETYGTLISGHTVNEVNKFAVAFCKATLKEMKDLSDDVFFEMSRRNIRIYVITGCPKHIISPYIDILPICDIYGTDYYVENNIYTGHVKQNLGLFETKNKIVKDLVKCGANIIYGIGDSESDEPILNNAIYPLAVGKKIKRIKNIHTNNISYINNKNARKVIRLLAP